MLMPTSGLAVHGVMLIVCYLVDRRRYPQHGIERYLPLRFQLTVGAATSCLLAAASRGLA